MKCPHFKEAYDIGMCMASKIAHIPGIDEMGGFCFKETFNLCAIPYGHRPDSTVKKNGYSNASVGHSAVELPQNRLLGQRT